MATLRETNFGMGKKWNSNMSGGRGRLLMPSSLIPENMKEKKLGKWGGGGQEKNVTFHELNSTIHWEQKGKTEKREKVKQKRKEK